MVIVGLLTGCGGSEESPEEGAREWIDAVVSQDGNKMIKYTCLTQREEVQQASTLVSAFTILGEFFGRNPTLEIEGDISDLKFETIKESDGQAEVRVYGELRTALKGAANAQQIDERWLIVKENDIWQWCGNITPQLAQQLADEATVAALADQRDAVPPEGIEQFSAAEAFQQYAQERSLQYRNAKYKTISNDGTFAEVVITLDGWDTTNETWLEHTTVINLRIIGGEWKADISNINVALTDKGKAALENAKEDEVHTTTQVLQTDLGGTLAYGLDNGSITIRKPDGSETTVLLPFNFIPRLLEIDPSRNGFYYVVEGKDGGLEHTINFYDLSEEKQDLLKKLNTDGPVESRNIVPL
jgi:hypothetical protein